MPRHPTGRPAGRPKSLMGYETLMCRLPRDHAALLKAAAQREGITVSALLRQALDDWMHHHLPPAQRPDVVHLRTEVTKILTTEVFADVQALEALLPGIGTLRFSPAHMACHAKQIRRGMVHLQQVLQDYDWSLIKEVTRIYKTELYADVKTVERMLTKFGTLRFAPAHIPAHAQGIQRGIAHVRQVLIDHSLLEDDNTTSPPS